MPGLIDRPRLQTWGWSYYNSSDTADFEQFGIYGVQIKQDTRGCLVLPHLAFAANPSLDPQFEKFRMKGFVTMVTVAEPKAPSGVSDAWAML